MGYRGKSSNTLDECVNLRHQLGNVFMRFVTNTGPNVHILEQQLLQAIKDLDPYGIDY